MPRQVRIEFPGATYHVGKKGATPDVPAKIFTRYSRAASLGGVDTEVMNSGRATHYTYDNAGQRTAVTIAYGSPEAAITNTLYTATGRVWTIQDADGHLTTYGYDALGRPTTVTDPLLRITTSLYETIPANGNTPGFERIRTKLPDTTQVANRVLDYLGRTATDTNANNETITYAYHLNTGLVLNYLDARAKLYQFTYDAAGQRRTRTFPEGPVHTYDWYGDGQLASEIRPDTNTATIHYDPRGLPRGTRGQAT